MNRDKDFRIRQQQNHSKQQQTTAKLVEKKEDCGKPKGKGQ